MPLELNPNHPVTQEVRDQWHKLCAVILHDMGMETFEVTSEQIESFVKAYGAKGAIVADTRGGRFVLRLVNEREAGRLARREGGLPV